MHGYIRVRVMSKSLTLFFNKAGNMNIEIAAEGGLEPGTLAPVLPVAQCNNAWSMLMVWKYHIQCTSTVEPGTQH